MSLAGLGKILALFDDRMREIAERSGRSPEQVEEFVKHQREQVIETAREKYPSLKVSR